MGEMVLKEVPITYFEVLSWHLSREAELDHKKMWVGCSSQDSNQVTSECEREVQITLLWYLVQL